MSENVEKLLARIKKLSSAEQQELTQEVLRLNQWPALSDDELTRLADELFVTLDEAEAADE